MKKAKIQDYVVKPAALNYFEPRDPWESNTMPYRDDTYRIPCEWIVANASRFYFTNKQILDAAQKDVVWPHARLWVVYFLIRDREIIYVGQSNYPERRMGQHRENGMRFDSVTWFEVPDLYANDIEAFYIWRCNPIRNNKWPASGDFGKAAKLLDEKYGEKRNEAVYVITISAPKQ